MPFESSNLGGKPLSEKEQLSSCVQLLLLWIAASDGKVDESELEFASTNFPETENAITAGDLLAIIKRDDLHSIEMAIHTVAAQSRELRIAFLDMAITMSMADHEIAISESHILRFYADALYLGIATLSQRFKAISGNDYIEPGDPGSLQWWDREESRSREDKNRMDRPAQAGDGEPSHRSPSSTGITDIEARTILVVGPDATQDEIERAYQTLTSIFQIQRVETMGSAAVSVARKRLQRVEDAYEFLRD